jgi:repressor of nif and glnA expression
MESGDTSEQVGRPAKYSDGVYLEAMSDLAEGDPDLVTSAANIHTRLIERDKEITRRAVYNRLYSLREKGLVECREISPEFHKWRITEAGVEALEEARREDEEDEKEGENGE